MSNKTASQSAARRKIARILVPLLLVCAAIAFWAGWRIQTPQKPDSIARGDYSDSIECTWCKRPARETHSRWDWAGKSLRFLAQSAWCGTMAVPSEGTGALVAFLPISETEIVILSGPFAGESMRLDPETGNIYHQKFVYLRR